MLRGATRLWRCAAAASSSSSSALSPSSASGASSLSPSAARALPSLDGPLFAVAWINNVQYRISEGDVLMVKRVRAEIGSSIALKKVAIVGGEKFTAIGRPLLDGARITCDVEEHNEARPLVHLVMPRIRRLGWNAHQQTYSVLRVTKVEYTPQIVAAVDKYTGDLDLSALDAPAEAENGVHWTIEPPLPPVDATRQRPVY